VSKQVQLVPVISEILGDMNTPVSAFLKLKKPDTFLLESVTGGEQVARYSIIGLNPFCTFRVENGKTTIKMDQNNYPLSGNPIDDLQKIMNAYSLEAENRLSMASFSASFCFCFVSSVLTSLYK